MALALCPPSFAPLFAERIGAESAYLAAVLGFDAGLKVRVPPPFRHYVSIG